MRRSSKSFVCSADRGRRVRILDPLQHGDVGILPSYEFKYKVKRERVSALVECWLFFWTLNEKGDGVRASDLKGGFIGDIRAFGIAPRMLRILRRIFLCFIVAATSVAPVRAVEKRLELGLPQVTIYTNEEIDAYSGSENSIEKDANGRILYASAGYLMAFDGSEWRRISRSGVQPVQEFVSLKTAPDGTIYVGGLSNWGKLSYDENGYCYLESFIEEGESIPDWGTEIFVHVEIVGDEVFFIGENHLVRWNPEEGNRIWPLLYNNGFVASYCCRLGEEIYCTRVGNTLSRLDGDEFEIVEGSEVLTKNGSKIVAQIRWFDGRQAFLNNRHGIVVFDGEKFENVKTELDDLLLEWHGLNGEFQLIEGDAMALSLQGLGIVFFDSKGRILNRIDERVDYRMLGCREMVLADDGSLWAIVSNGVAKILNPNRITFIDSRFGIDLDWYQLDWHQGDMIITKINKMYRGLYAKDHRLVEFEPVEQEMGLAVNDVLSMEDGLLLACQDHLRVQWNEGKSEVLCSDIAAVRIHRSIYDPSLFIVAEEFHAQVFRRIGRTFVPVGSRVEVGMFNKMVEGSKGRVWFERGIQSVAKLDISKEPPTLRIFGEDDGLPPSWIPVWNFNGIACLSAAESILRYDEATDSLVHYSEVEDIIPDDIKMITRPALDSSGNLWVAALDGNLIMRKQKDGSYLADRISLHMLKNYIIDEIRFEEDDVAWLLSRHVLARVDIKAPISGGAIPMPIIDEMRRDGNANLFYHPNVPEKNTAPKIEYKDNDLVIRFSTPYYTSMKDLYHRYKLDEQMDEWSEFEHISQARFSNLPGDEYIFQVQAATEGGERSPIREFSFVVKKPLYQTIPAYIVYVICLYGMIYLVLRLRHNRLVNYQRELQHRIDDQTAELKSKSEAMRLAMLKERELKLRAEKALEERAALNTVKSRLETQLIKSCIQPHFLMNTLNALAAWVEDDPEKGVRFINELSNHFDHLLRMSGKKLIPIRDEIDICGSLLAIMSYRSEIEFKLEVEGVDDRETIPPCIFHTIVENGVTHNEYTSGEVVFRLSVCGKEDGCVYRVDVPFSNSSSGFEFKPRGTGMKYVEARLKESYSDSWSLLSRRHGENWRTEIVVFDKSREMFKANEDSNCRR